MMGEETSSPGFHLGYLKAFFKPYIMTFGSNKERKNKMNERQTKVKDSQFSLLNLVLKNEDKKLYSINKMHQPRWSQ
jgi:hypothetical protein